MNLGEFFELSEIGKEYFESFYSDRESVGDVYWDKPGAASSQRSHNEIHQTIPESTPLLQKNPKNSSISPITEEEITELHFEVIVKVTDYSRRVIAESLKTHNQGGANDMNIVAKIRKRITQVT